MDNYRIRSNRLAGFIVWGAAIGLVLSACQGTRTNAAMAELQQMQTAALADGVVTPDEANALHAKEAQVAQTAKDEASQWPELLSTGVATFMATLLGVRVWRGPSTKGQP